MMAIKLYKNSDGVLHYWEAWARQDGKSAIIHWGKVGERGDYRIVESDIFSNFEKKVQKERDKLEDYVEIDDTYTLWIEYPVDGMGTVEDIDKRTALEDRMNDLLGWTGLGYCDGGSIGSGTMEVCCFVVDFDFAKQVIEADLKGTEFGDFTRIYDENA